MTICWSLILGEDNHRDKLRYLLQERSGNQLCNHLGVSSTALRNKFNREDIIPKKQTTIREQILSLGNTSKMTTKEIASRIGKSKRSVSEFCSRNDISRVKLYYWAKERSLK
jgi:hypothetical protein